MGYNRSSVLAVFLKCIQLFLKLLILYADVAADRRNSLEIESFNSSVHPARRGMVLPFQPLSLAFKHVNYHVDMPAVSQ